MTCQSGLREGSGPGMSIINCQRKVRCRTRQAIAVSVLGCGKQADGLKPGSDCMGWRTNVEEFAQQPPRLDLGFE